MVAHPEAGAAAPKDTPAIRLMRLNWESTLRRDGGGTPTLPPSFVAEQGQLVRILDLRETAELVGPLGHIPAVTHLPMERLGEVPRVLDRETCVVLVSQHGDRAGVAARYLEALGMHRVAALQGGMAAWRAQGYVCLRDPNSYRQELFALAPGMGRDGRPLHAEACAGPLTQEQIQQHVGDPHAVRWVKLAALALHGKRSCVDGRDDHGVIGTPGGDAGELLLALAAIESIRGQPLSQREVAQILEKHIDTFGRFYMHSDLHAMNRLIVDGLRRDDRITPYLGTVFDPQEWRHWLAHPPEAARHALLEHLSRPEYMGCGHLRFAMTDPGYGVRPELAEAFLKAFHQLRWAGAPELEWVVLGGEHVEAAVASVVVTGALHSYTRIPLVSPMVAGAQMFVNHPQVTAYLRAELATHLTESGVCPGDVAHALLPTLERLGAAQAGATLSRLAAGLPVFEIRFDHQAPPEVSAIGVIGKP